MASNGRPAETEATHRTDRERERSASGWEAAALDMARDAILRVGVDGRIHYANLAAETLSGRQGAELIGASLERFQDRERDHASLERLREALGAGERWAGRLAFVTGDGRVLETEQAFRPCLDERGVPGSLVTLRDLSEADQLLLTAGGSEQAKRDFVGMLSHEMLTPLTAIKESVGLVAEGLAGPLNQTQGDFVQAAARNIDRLHGVVGRLLDFAALEWKHADLTRKGHDAHRLLREAAALQTLRRGERPADVQGLPDGPGPTVYVDQSKTQQVLTNLLAEAVRYSEGRPVVVTVRVEGEEAVLSLFGRDVEPAVVAAGPRLSVFDTYVQIGSQLGGSGIELAICRLLINLQGGRIWATGGAAEGTAFHVALPLAQRE